MQDNEKKDKLTAKARQNLQTNEFLRRLEWGRLKDIPLLEHSIQGAIFDSERIVSEREKEEVDGNKVLKFKFIYIITNGQAPPWDNDLFKLTVDSKISAKIDAYLSEGINVLDIQILRTPKGIRYRIEPFEHCPSVSGISTVMHIVEKYNIIVDVALLLLSLSPMPVDYWEQGHQ
jgi:hypothetical protein